MYFNQTLLSLITVSCLLSRAELLLLLVHHDFATSSFTFTHPLWPLPDSEISNTFFFFSFFPDPILYVNIFLVKSIGCVCSFFLSSNNNNTVILYSVSSGPEQGFPCVVNSYREKPVLITGNPCSYCRDPVFITGIFMWELLHRGIPVVITENGFAVYGNLVNPCKHSHRQKIMIYSAKGKNLFSNGHYLILGTS